MEIIYIIIVLFGLTTVMGLYLSSLALRNKITPNSIIWFHAICSIAAFILLSFYYPESLKIIWSFSIATAFGAILLYQDILGIKYTKWLCYAHAVFTIAGCAYLLVFAVELTKV